MSNKPGRGETGMSEASKYCACGHLYGQHYGCRLKSPCHASGCGCKDWEPKPRSAQPVGTAKPESE